MTATARRISEPRLTEAQFQRQVVDLARIRGWDLVYHAQLAKWSEAGWPDLFLLRVRDRRLLFVELKAEKGKLSDRQEAVLDYLRAISDEGAGIRGPRSMRQRRIEVHVWRPSDWDEIEQVLA